MSEPAASYSEPSALPGEEPQAQAATAYLLHADALRLWRWQGWLLALGLAVPGVVVNLLRGEPRAALLSLPFMLAVGLLMSVYSRAYARRFSCMLYDDGLRVVRGVNWREEVFVSRSRIQHTEVHSGPIARHFGIAGLRIHTAGTQLGKIEVQGLSQADAVELRDRLLDRHGRRDEV